MNLLCNRTRPSCFAFLVALAVACLASPLPDADSKNREEKAKRFWGKIRDAGPEVFRKGKDDLEDYWGSTALTSLGVTALKQTFDGWSASRISHSHSLDPPQVTGGYQRRIGGSSKPSCTFPS